MMEIAVFVVAAVAMTIAFFWAGWRCGRDAEEKRWVSRISGDDVVASYSPITAGDRSYLVFDAGVFYRDYHNPLARYRRDRNRIVPSPAERMYG